MDLRTVVLTGLLLWLGGLSSFAQKEVFIPNEWGDDPALQEWSWDRSYQSENFVVFWGPEIGTDPSDASNSELRFNPAALTDTLESSYDLFVDELQFVRDDSTTNLGTYKIIVVINETWGEDGPTGWAFGGSYSETIGAMWVHPQATQGGAVLSHEFAHTLQSMNWIQRNTDGGGFVNYEPAGFFWEAHANFMRAQQYPELAAESMPRWWATHMYHWSSTRHHYQAYRLLLHMQRRDGIEMVHRLWWESEENEHPLETYRRLKGWGQAQLNDFAYDYARRDVTYDYPVRGIGEILREEAARYRREEPHSLWRRYTVLNEVGSVDGRYMVPEHLAPQDYGFNVIPLYPSDRDEPVRVKFKGHTEVNGTAGWRYGFVTANAEGEVVNYSRTYAADNQVISYTLDEGEQQLYLVVLGAPTQHTSYSWEPGWPKIKRYPYEIALQNAVPHGHQSTYRDQFRERFSGHSHENGGGFVSDSASVAAGVYVGEDAMVVGEAAITGNVRVEDRAWVEDARMSGEVVVSGNANVFGGVYEDQATVTDFAIANYTRASERAQLQGNMIGWGDEFGGNIVVGGDAEIGSCSEGVYLQVPHSNNGREPCDGRGRDHPSNRDVNADVVPFSDFQMRFPEDAPSQVTLKANYPNPVVQSTTIPFALPSEMTITLEVYDLLGRRVEALISERSISAGYHTQQWQASDLASGVYLIRLQTPAGVFSEKVTVVR